MSTIKPSYRKQGLSCGLNRTMEAGVLLILLSSITNFLAFLPYPLYVELAWALLIAGVAVTGVGAWESALTKKAGGIGIILGCGLAYVSSLFAWAPQGVAGYMQWGIPFQWHSVGTGDGEPMLGPYHYVMLYNLGLDIVLWCALATAAAYGLLFTLGRESGEGPCLGT